MGTSPPISMRFGAEADTGREPWPEGFRRRSVSFCRVSSCIFCFVKMSSMYRRFSSLALSSPRAGVDVLVRDVPRFRAFPKGPFSSGTRRCWVFSELNIVSWRCCDRRKLYTQNKTVVKDIACMRIALL